MSEIDQKNQSGRHAALLTPWSKWLKRLAVGGGFIALLLAVFVVSNRMAATTSVGFPNFQDSQFDLIDQYGNQRQPKDFKGQPIALFFGFTYCPDICPTTLMTLTSAQDQIAATGQAADHLQILFVTVDPDRDTAAQLQAYLGLFDVAVTGLTGSQDAIKATLKHFGIYAEKTGQGDDYLYDHSAAVYLYRADGSFKGTIVHNEPFDYAIEKIKSIL